VQGLHRRGGGSLTVAAGGDGLQAYAEDDAALGYVIVQGGAIDIDASGDGIQAATAIQIDAGTFDITAQGDGIVAGTTVTVSGGSFTAIKTGGGSGTAAGSTSCKGIKAGTSLSISSGTFSSISSADDAIHCDGGGSITGGSFAIAANSTTGQGIKFGDSSSFSIGGSTTSISIASSFEGIAGFNLTVSGGTIVVNASNDGFSMSAGTAEGGAEYDDGARLSISGGYIVVAVSNGDGVDSNGSISMSGGTLIVHGPVSAPEEALDCNGTFAITGGTLIAASNYNNMTKAPTSATGQCAILVNLGSSKSTGVLVHIQNASDTDILTFAPAKSYQALIFSSPSLTAGSYSVYYGGGSTGTAKDGLYSGGSYSAGTLFRTKTLSSGVTTIN
jgi:hypothetical protein